MEKACKFVEDMTRNGFQLMAVCCTRKRYAYVKTPARDLLKQVTRPSTTNVGQRYRFRNGFETQNTKLAAEAASAEKASATFPAEVAEHTEGH
jgi:hypothetical protein